MVGLRVDGLALLLFAGFALRPLLCLGDDAVDLAMTAWKNRQEKIKSLRVGWTEEVTVEKGFWADPEVDGVPTAQPAEDVSFERKVKLIFDGRLIKIETDGFDCSLEGDLVPTSCLATFDGKVFTRYRKKSTAEWPDAVIETRAGNHDAKAISYLPVMLFCRITDPEMGTVTEPPRLERNGIVDTDACLILGDSPSSSHVREFWVAPEKCYVVRRFQILKRTARGLEVNDQMDIEYGKHGDMEWAPTSWRYTLNSVGALPKLYTVGQVQVFEVDPVVDRTEFDRPDFAVGTWVLRDDTSPHHGWIALEDGKRRPVLESEVGAAYDQLRHSAPGQAVPGNTQGVWRVRTRLALMLVSLLVLGIVGYLLVKSSRLRRRG